MTKMIKRKCHCGTTYFANPVRLRHGRETTCSRACSYTLRTNNRKNGRTMRCGTCEVEFTRTPSKIKSKHATAYCSPACMYTGRTLGLTPRIVTAPYIRVAPVNMEAIARTVATRKARNNYGHTDETRARLREATTRAIAEGRIPAVSKLEDEVAIALTDMGIAYQRQAPIRGTNGRYVAAVDFLLDDGRALEVNGTFWHTDPRVYPAGPTYPAQRRTAERWDRKVAALAALGIPLIVAWEKDLREQLTKTLEVTLATV